MSREEVAQDSGEGGANNEWRVEIHAQGTRRCSFFIRTHPTIVLPLAVSDDAEWRATMALFD